MIGVQASDKQAVELPEELNGQDCGLRQRTPDAVWHQDQSGRRSKSIAGHAEEFMAQDAEACQVSCCQSSVLLFVQRHKARKPPVKQPITRCIYHRLGYIHTCSISSLHGKASNSVQVALHSWPIIRKTQTPKAACLNLNNE